jgi:hypothetical protein
VYDAVPDLEAILRGQGASIPVPAEVSVKYATVIGLALRARTGDDAVNGFRWVVRTMSAEWTRTFMKDLVRSMQSKGLQGPLAMALREEPAFKALLTDFSSLQVTR